jgi:hypothetical protein
MKVRFAVFMATTVTMVLSGLANGQQATRDNSRAAAAYLERDDVLTFYQLGAPTQAGSCSQRKQEKPQTCNCNDGHGNTVKKTQQCYSCYNSVGGQKCAGPFCDSCAVVCNPAGTHQTEHPGPC